MICHKYPIMGMAGTVINIQPFLFMGMELKAQIFSHLEQGTKMQSIIYLLQ